MPIRADRPSGNQKEFQNDAAGPLPRVKGDWKTSLTFLSGLPDGPDAVKNPVRQHRQERVEIGWRGAVDPRPWTSFLDSHDLKFALPAHDQPFVIPGEMKALDRQLRWPNQQLVPGGHMPEMEITASVDSE